jgi:hypothetical protein
MIIFARPTFVTSILSVTRDDNYFYEIQAQTALHELTWLKVPIRSMKWQYVYANK